MKDLFKDALAAGFLALMLSLVLIGVHTKTVNAELVVDYRFDAVAVCVGFVFWGRFGMGLL